MKFLPVVILFLQTITSSDGSFVSNDNVINSKNLRRRTKALKSSKHPKAMKSSKHSNALKSSKRPKALKSSKHPKALKSSKQASLSPSTVPTSSPSILPTSSPTYSDWKQLGSDINGEAARDESGWSVSLSADGSIVAIGANRNDGNGNSSGHVRVYSFLGV
mmetsp:Transcript_20638/g.28995  ORF Transcript_20638/g.28995 Transcript_20638/m.28995 type:complete len:162 (+) Transcript_20638:299-784(+)